ncbi:DUF2490 domain-containing protein [Crocinitomicaceae bacterium]|nr:DUF2490 domain-containing protein [Crocinitomicaceae bacterium]
MKTLNISLLIALFSFNLFNSDGQVDESQTGGWYMYFFNTSHEKSKIGFQGDVQYRNWNIVGDLEQLLLRGGVTFKPEKANIKFTLGYGNITTGTFGEESSTTNESRIYQEALFPTKIGERFYLNHRLRYEQRFIEEQTIRTRYRYNLFVNVALNQKEMKEKTIYLALYDELFINGTGMPGQSIFDRNRAYIALGYVLKKGMKFQLGIMNQTTNTVNKNQLQLSFHHAF